MFFVLFLMTFLTVAPTVCLNVTVGYFCTSRQMVINWMPVITYYSDIILHKSGPILYISATNHDFPLALKSGFNLQQNVYKSNFLCHFVSVLRIPSLLWGHPYSCILLVPESCSEMMTITSSENLIFSSSEIKVSMFQFF